MKSNHTEDRRSEEEAHNHDLSLRGVSKACEDEVLRVVLFPVGRIEHGKRKDVHLKIDSR